jgi:hypothetical protein
MSHLYDQESQNFSVFINGIQELITIVIIEKLIRKRIGLLQCEDDTDSLLE